MSREGFMAGESVRNWRWGIFVVLLAISSFLFAFILRGEVIASGLKSSVHSHVSQPKAPNTQATSPSIGPRNPGLGHRSPGLGTKTQSSMPGALSPNPEARYLQEAAKWYAKYHALAPDDLLGLKKLVEICEELEKAGIEPETLKEELERRTDDKRTVAEVVGLKVDEFELGENLVENGGFEVGEGQPKAWRWAAWVGGKRNEGTFAGGLDKSQGYEGDGCLRIKGFWVGREEGKERARVGYWGGRDGLKLKPRTPYVLSFYYKTEGLQGGEANVYSRGGRQVVFGGKGLPRTDGSWRKFAIIGWNALDEPVNLHRFILARNFGVGDVWFDEVELQEIVLKPGARIEDTATRFESR